MDRRRGLPRVLVVGAGPSGLMVAHELRRFGISCSIIERDVKKSPYSRAIAVQIRTLEIFSALGLFDNLAAASQAVSSIEIYAERSTPITIDIAKTSSFFERLLVVDQPHTESVLENALAIMGQDIRRGVELIDFHKDASGITARLRLQNNDVITERFSHIIGADGAHSLVRKKMANQFLGTTYDDAFILADVECVQPFDHHTFRIFFRKRRLLVLIPMHGPNHYRLIGVRKGESKKQGPLPTLEEFQALARKIVPYDLEFKNPVWVSRFFVQCRSATSYQEDEQIFLVGDAAHIHSPAGGQGMNTGLQDAFNLAWKLALSIKGQATRELVRSYEMERKPVGDFLIERTDRLFKLMVKSSPWIRLMRLFVLPIMVRSQNIMRKLFTIGSQTAIRYEHGVICPRPDHVSLAFIKLGVRIPNLRVSGKKLGPTDLHTLACGQPYFSCWFFLPQGADKDQVNRVLAAKAEIRRQFSDSVTPWLVFTNDRDGGLVPELENYLISVDSTAPFIANETFYIIVRPDHHVFCAGALNELPHAVDGLKRYLLTADIAA